MEDFCYFCVHRTLHLPYIYPLFHKIHHEAVSTISISATYMHPFEFLSEVTLPISLGSLLCPFTLHLSTFVLYIWFKTLFGIEDHCGYEFPVGLRNFIPLNATGNYHNHHHLFNLGNYCAGMVIWDSIFGTNKEYFKQIETTLQTKKRGEITRLKKE